MCVLRCHAIMRYIINASLTPSLAENTGKKYDMSIVAIWQIGRYTAIIKTLGQVENADFSDIADITVFFLQLL